jgi:hypothetical protein
MLANMNRLARLTQLVASGKQRDRKAASHRHRSLAKRCQQPKLGRPEPPTGRERHAAGGDILTGNPPVGTALDAWTDEHGGPVGAAIFLHDHRVGAVGHDRAGEDAGRSTGGQPVSGGMAGGNACVHDKPCFGIAD